MSRRTQFLTIALLLACLAAVPLLVGGGLLNSRGGGDSPFLLQRLQQLETAVWDGHFPVRWMPDANYGYGYPFYNFYAPLSVYIAFFFRLIGFSYVYAIQMAQLTGFLVAAWGMFCLGERWFRDEWAGLLAAAAYTFAPFHLVNVYVRGDSLAEFWAMAFYPLIILTAENLMAGQVGRKAVTLFALSYAGLILSHNISALIFSPFLLLYLLFRFRQLTIDHLRLTIGSFLLAFALAAWFFLPALAEQNMAQLGPVTAGYFHFSNHFRSHDLVQTSFLFNYNPDGGTAFRMGLVQAGTAVLGLLILLFRQPTADRRPPTASNQSLLAIYCLLLTVLATFLITPLARPLWEHLPLLNFTQFPWRFLSVQAFGVALVTAVFATLPLRRYLVPGVIGVMVLSSLGSLKPDYLSLNDADITAESLAQYEWFTGNIGTTVSAEYLPPTVQPRPTTSNWLNTGERWQIRPLSGTLYAAQLTNQNALHQNWQVNSTGATLLFPTLYWPGWMAEIDGKSTEIRPSPGSGLITLDVPDGQHTITLNLARTPIRWLAELISAVAWLWVIYHLRLTIDDLRLVFHSPRFKFYGSLFIIYGFLLFIQYLWSDKNPSPDNLTWDFAQMGYLHHDEEGVLFENGARLLSYNYDQEQVVAGESLEITLQWETAESLPPSLATLSLVTPAANRFLAPVLTTDTQPIQPGTAVYHLLIPANAPAGLYVPQVMLENSHPLMPSGDTRGDLFLRPLRITAPPTVIDAEWSVNLQVNQVNAHTNSLDVQLAWFTAQPLAENLNVSLRLTDHTGLELAQFDTQPGFGFLPSSLWQPSTWVNDWLTLPLPEKLPLAPYYPLTIRLYDVAHGDVWLTRHLGQMVWAGGDFIFQKNEPVFTLPEAITPFTAEFVDTTGQPILQLHGYVVLQTADSLQLFLYWGALADGTTDYTRFVHLIDPATNTPPLAQNDGIPRYNSYPTGQWVAGEVVTDPVTLDLTAVPPGDYQLVVGFYRKVGDGFERLTAVAADGSPFPNNQVLLPITINH